ncbi:hypothetical protein SARC_03021 [Sphaeroforma arctica JP610]|uniref:Spindle pole body component n=1 Tax=Sphaeroforma arctica JP610 TaxID=667725 RepID=A0A0L0G781_9EUKA|nr:hypothetical protein SARC_03021 [Sphaeroforma arctica JP610]KNC84779.1 hypothetical protein SARC_03021 [Sphaeroforma arctica JP610]|eukprot:XP_014158681.1 hypothetical protein SARC_03021 [Sphaeroforma arctica JP610]
MSFEYKAPWPLPLILTRTSLTKYTLLSRHLFHCKGLENKVSQTWMIGGQATMQKARTACPRAFALRQRILQFLQSLLYYTQCEVIEPLWKEMEAVLTNSKSTLDDFIASHADFLDTCIIQCMLTSEPVLKTIYKLLMICRDFTGMFSSLVSGSRDQTHLQWYTQTETRFGELGLDLIKGLRKISNLNQDGEKAASFLRSLECLT